MEDEIVAVQGETVAKNTVTIADIQQQSGTLTALLTSTISIYFNKGITVYAPPGIGTSGGLGDR